MKNDGLLDVASRAVKLAQSKGAQQASASAYRSREVEMAWRDGKTEKVSEATTRGLSVQLYVDGRYSAVSTKDLRPEALARFIDESVAMARVLAKDPYRSLPDPKLFAGRANVDLELVDDKYDALDAATRQRLARETEEAARASDLRGRDAIVSVTTSFSDTSHVSARVTSNGFEGEHRTTEYWLSADVTAKDADGRRPEGSEWAGARTFAALPSPAAIGRGATVRAIDTLGAKKVPSAVLPMIVEARSAGRLVRALLASLSAESLQQKRSFLDGKLGAEVASRVLTMSDDPLLKKGFGSRTYDNECITARPFHVIEAGVLKSYYVDDYYGRKLKMAPTTKGPSNLVFAAGSKSPNELMAAMKEGFVVTAFLGGNSNATTGDFSLGVQGFRVRNGERAEPVAEMNIAGNQLALWKSLAALGNDPYPYASIRTPALLFDGVQFAGV